jgi:acetyl-CoA C-acetyltransferase
MENMDLAPYLVPRARWGYRMGDGQLYDSVLRDGLNDAFSDAHSGWHTEDLIEKYQVTRDAQDRWALRSQQRFASSQAAGHFKAQIVPVEVPGKKGPVQFDKDEHNRPDTTLETLARLKPAFRPNGTITAGNAPGLNDAASAVVLADATWAEKRGVTATARLVAYGIAAVEPGMFGLGPVPAVQQALQMPVTFPSGRAWLAARPRPIGSTDDAATIGMLAVACFAATAAVELPTTITSGLSRTTSSASVGSRVRSPSAYRYSIS